MVTAADYARAEKLFWAFLAPKVRNTFPSPVWIGETACFIYRHELAGGHEFRKVDASNGLSTPAFDHQAAAQALGNCGVEAADPKRLPLDLLECGGDGTLLFAQGPRRLRYDGAAFEELHEPEREHHLCYSPDGARAVSVREGNLYLLDCVSGEELQLTQDGSPDNGYGLYYDNWQGSFIPRKRSGKAFPPFGTTWEPGGRYFIVPRIDQSHVAPYPLLESAPHDGSFRPKVHEPRIPLMGEKPAVASWYSVEVKTGAVRRIDLPDGLLFVHQDAILTRRHWWSADGTRAYALAHGSNMGAAYLFDVDLATGEVRTVVEDHIAPRTDLNGSSYTPPNVSILGDLDEVIWFSTRDGWGHLYLYNGRSGELKRPLTSGEWFVRDIVHVDASRREIYVTGAGREGGNPYYRYLYRISLDGGEPVLLTPEEADHELSHMLDEAILFFEKCRASPISPCGQFIVYTYSTVDQPPKSVIRSTRDGRLIASLVDADANAAFEVGYRPPRTFTVKAADGVTDLYGILHTPPGMEPGKRYPVVISQYTTPIAPASPKTFMRAVAGSGGRLSPAPLAELGFVVMSLDPRGTGFRGGEVDSGMDGRLNLMGTDDYASAIAQLGERFSWFDADRVGIYGGSYGGFTVVRAMLEFPDVFKVGVATVPMGGLHNMYPDYHWMAWQGLPHYANGAGEPSDPRDIPVNYQSLNSNAQVDRLKGDLLLILSELDENVLPGSTMQFIAALVEADQTFDMLMLPNANHGTAARTRHVVRRHMDYFVEHLMGEKPPRDFRFELLPQGPEPDSSDAIW